MKDFLYFPSDVYKRQIQIRLSKENTLVIYAPEICEKELVTNDIAEINGQNPVSYTHLDVYKRQRQILAYMEYRYHHSTRTTGFYCSCR